MTSFAEVVFGLPANNNIRVGVVTATSPLEVSLNGGRVMTPGRLASYTPGVGDIVAMVRQDSTWLVLGEIMAG